MLYILLLWLTLATCNEEQPYCTVRYRRLCQGKGRHVACQFSDPGPGASCMNYTAIKFNNDMKNFILYYVNRRRQRIASGTERVRGGLVLPKPEIMMLVFRDNPQMLQHSIFGLPCMGMGGTLNIFVEGWIIKIELHLEWDRELSFLAQRLADQCSFVHDDCRATVRYPYAGQTVGEVRWRRTGEAVERGARRAIRRVLDAWWGERRRASPHLLTAPFRLAAKGAVWGHFSQLCVWSLQAMGCGAVHHGASHPRLLLVCDFSHTNMLGQRTLNPGPLAPCPIHTMRKPRSQYPLLCAPVRQPLPSEPEDDIYEDDEFDPGLTVDMGDVTTSIHTKNREKEQTSRTHRTEPSILVFREDLTTKSLMIEKLDRELEVRNKAEYKSQVTEDQVIQEWRSRPPFFRHYSENQKSIDRVIALETTMRREHLNEMEYYNPTSITYAENNLRHRWKQTRNRPMRPGANALLMTPAEHSRRQPVVSLMLDKDDVAQLFRDTGFQVKTWKKN